MALNGLICADVPLSHCSLTLSDESRLSQLYTDEAALNSSK